jgi:tripartite-type tricarboxylate transporter receptor subunit TctC
MIALVAAIWAWNSSASFSADGSADDFYRHKTITLIVGTDASGEYDAMARLLARHFGKHIPGNPNIIVENMPGASGIKSADYLFAAAPRDGTVLATFNQSIPMEQAMKVANTNYQSDRFNWIGTFTRSNDLLTVMARTGVETIDDATRKSLTIGCLGVGGTMCTHPLLLNHVFGTKFVLVPGYAGAQLVNLAMARGEVDGRGVYTWSDLKSAHPEWLTNHTINNLVQFGYAREKDLPNVPTMMELAKTEEERAVFRFVSSDIEMGRAYVLPPGVPPDRVETLRRGFDATLADPEFLDDAKKLKVDVVPISGEELQGIVKDVIATPREIVDKAQALMRDD